VAPPIWANVRGMANSWGPARGLLERVQVPVCPPTIGE